MLDKPSTAYLPLPTPAGPLGLANRTEPAFVVKFAQWSWLTLILASVLQCSLFPSTANWVSVAYILVAWAIFTKVFLRPDVLQSFPLSTFLVLGFTTTQFYFPLLFTLFEAKPVVFNLERPYEVFLHSMAALLVLVVAHLFYRVVLRDVNKRSHSLLGRAGFFDAPSQGQLWLMGLMGIGATFYVYFFTLAGKDVTGAASDKFIHAFLPFSYAPYFIPFGRLYNSKEVTTKRTVLLLVLFTLFLFALSIARNNRTGFIIGFTSVGFSYGFGLLLDYFKPRFFTLRNVLLGVVGLWIVTGPVADISTAMVMVRDDRDKISPVELLDRTVEAYFDKEGIRLHRLSDSKVDENRFWDEHYMNNVFLARFCNLKYNDLSLMMAAKVSIPDTDMFNFTVDHLLAQFPKPVLDFLDIDVDKEFVNFGSFADYFHFKVSGNPWVIGGFRTGHLSGVSLAAFGWWYLAILGIGMLPIFFLVDKFSLRKRLPATAGHPQPSVLVFSMCGLLELTGIFRYLTIESVEGIGAFLLRGWLQMVLLYFLLYHLTRLVSGVLAGVGGRGRVGKGGAARLQRLGASAYLPLAPK